MTHENPIYTQDDTFSARLDRRKLHAIYNPGVLEGLSVSAGTGMQVLVQPGGAVIEVITQTSPPSGSYLQYNNDEEAVTIAAAPGSNSRIDVLIYRVDDENSGGTTGVHEGSFEIVQGTVANIPSVPAVGTINHEVLAHIFVNSGDTEIVSIVPKRRAALVKGSVPPGTVVAYTGEEASVPTGWALAIGQEFNRVSEFALFAALGTIHGNGNGSTTFNGPDHRGVIHAGKDNMGGTAASKLAGLSTLGAMTGAQTMTMTSAHLVGHSHTSPSHNHSIPTHNHSWALSSYNGTTVTKSIPHTHNQGSLVNSHENANHQHGSGFGYPGQLYHLFRSTATSGGMTIEAGIGMRVDWYSENTGIHNNNHEHSIAGNTGNGDNSHNHSFNVPGQTRNTSTTGSSNTGSSAANTNATGGSSAFSLMQPTTIINFIVKL
jgi:microcystin-dependent protein